MISAGDNIYYYTNETQKQSKSQCNKYKYLSLINSGADPCDHLPMLPIYYPGGTLNIPQKIFSQSISATQCLIRVSSSSFLFLKSTSKGPGELLNNVKENLNHHGI